MPLIKNEQDVKRDSQFLKYESGDAGNILILKSHLYQINSHFLKSVSRSVECRSEECLYCQAGYQKRTEYNYMVFLNGQDGFLDVKPSVFFAIQSIAKAQKRDVRQISWTVIKKGEGLNTDYTTSKDDNLGEDDYKELMEQLDVNTQKLVASMERHEEDLSNNYANYLDQIKDQKTPEIKYAGSKRADSKQKEVIKPIAVDSIKIEQDISPDEIPF